MFFIDYEWVAFFLLRFCIIKEMGVGWRRDLIYKFMHKRRFK